MTQIEQSVGTTDGVSQVRHHKMLALAGDDTLYGTRYLESSAPRTPSRPDAKRERAVQTKDYDGLPFRMTGLTTVPSYDAVAATVLSCCPTAVRC